MYVRVQYKIKNRTIRPSIVQNQKSYYTSEYSTKSKIILYVRVQYKIKNRTVCPSIVQNKKCIVRPSTVQNQKS